MFFPKISAKKLFGSLKQKALESWRDLKNLKFGNLWANSGFDNCQIRMEESNHSYSWWCMGNSLDPGSWIIHIYNHSWFQRLSEVLCACRFVISPRGVVGIHVCHTLAPTKKSQKTMEVRPHLLPFLTSEQGLQAPDVGRTSPCIISLWRTRMTTSTPFYAVHRSFLWSISQTN